MTTYLFKKFLKRVSARKLGRLWCGALFLTFIFAAQTAWADPDPCDLTADFTTHDQLVACFRTKAFDPALRDNIADVIEQHRNTADIADNLNALTGWRARLNTIRNTTYDSEFDMMVAFEQETAAMESGHYSFFMPACYQTHYAFLPFGFGSMMKGTDPDKQMIILDSVYPDGSFVGTDVYAQQTGIDIYPFIYDGLEIVSIDGQDPKTVLAEYSKNVIGGSSDLGGALMRELNNNLFTIRLDGDEVAERSSITVVVRSKNQIEQEVVLPFVYRNRYSPAYRMTSTAQFEHFCETGQIFLPVAGANGAVEESPAIKDLEELAVEDLGMLGDPELKIRKAMQNEIKILGNGKSSAEYHEVPRGLVDKHVDDITGLFPANGTVKVFQLKENEATIIKMTAFSGFASPTIKAATDYACENSKTLMFDLRNNSGGDISIMEWIAAHLLTNSEADEDGVSMSSLSFRTLTDNPVMVEQIDYMEGLRALLGYDDTYCYGGTWTAGCYLDPDTQDHATLIGDPIPPYWHQTTDVVEDRGGVSRSLSKRVVYDGRGYIEQLNSLLPTPISCPGKFIHENLIFLGDGAGASAAWFSPNQLRPAATLVTVGGIKGVPMSFAQARGGFIWSVGNFDIYRFYGDLYIHPEINPIARFTRGNINAVYEQGGAYTNDPTVLSVDLGLPETVGDLHVDTWNDPEFIVLQGPVYAKVLSAVKSNKQALANKKGW